MRILFIGDIFGKTGRQILADKLSQVRADFGTFDFVVINCENAAAGFGLTERLMDELFALGVDVMTSGNHIWDKKEFVPILDRESRVLRPANYPPTAPGKGYVEVEKNGLRLCVISLQGRAFMPPTDCPFRTMDDLLGMIKTPAILVDFHAEATAEKIALARYFDGRVSAVVGTHTHVQTADESLFPKGTAYITDVGMTGGHGGVIGTKFESVLPKFISGIPCKFEPEESDPRLQGVVIEIDDETGLALDIKRINIGTE